MRKLKLEELNRVSQEEFIKLSKIPVIVVLDNVRSAMNVGSVFRTADAFAFEKVILCGITAIPPNREITKTAIGATESVSWEYYENTAEAVKSLKAEGYVIAGIEQTDKSVSLDHYKPDKIKTALVFGNEVEGISDDVLEWVDVCIEIPQFGTKHSLNVSVCAGIVMWEYGKLFFAEVSIE
ncbi:MAG: RNA methyltransferase [Saprospiraceae bacterium]|nr:RNA methyltransferase [Saprospiraceae bacterium]